MTGVVWSATHESHSIMAGAEVEGYYCHAQATHEEMFDPPLPAEKAEAIARMGFGVINKVYIVSDAPEQQVRAQHQ